MKKREVKQRGEKSGKRARASIWKRNSNLKSYLFLLLRGLGHTLTRSGGVGGGIFGQRSKACQGVAAWGSGALTPRRSFQKFFLKINEKLQFVGKVFDNFIENFAICPKFILKLSKI